jgi:hypothetical protein
MDMIRTRIRALAAIAALLLLAACAGSVIDRDHSGLVVRI